MTKLEEQFHVTIKSFVAALPSHEKALADEISARHKLPPEVINQWLEGLDFPETTTRTRIIDFTVNHTCYCELKCK